MSSSWAGPYRDHEESITPRLEDALARIGRELGGDALPIAKRLYRRRLARAVAGVVAALVGLVTLAVGLFDGIRSYGGASRAAAPWVLIGGLALVAAVYLVARCEGGWRVGRTVRRAVAQSGTAAWDLARLEHASPLRDVRARARALEHVSIASPLVALALLSPLALHGAIYLVMGLSGRGPSIDGFGWWMGFSAIIVGHAHLLLAFLSLRFASQLHASEGVYQPKMTALRALGWTTLAAALPGILLLALPPAVTFITGVFTVLPAFDWARRTLAAERLALAV
jgi:hypothetical protein